MKSRFCTRRRVAVWALIAALLLACGSILHDRQQTQREIATIERIDRLGGHVSTYREYPSWVYPLQRLDWVESVVGHDAYNVVLPKTSLTADAVHEIAALRHVRSLDLSDATGIDDAALAAALATAPGLIVLKLAGTAVTDAGIAALPAMPDLMNVDLDDTSVTDVGVDALVRRSRMTLVHAGTGATAVTGEGITVSSPLRAGGTVNITGTIVVRNPPTLAKLGVYALLCEPGKRNGHYLGPAAGLALKPVAGRQTFAFTGTVGPRRPGRYVLQVSVGATAMPNVTYRLLRQDVDVLPATTGE